MEREIILLPIYIVPLGAVRFLTHSMCSVHAQKTSGPHLRTGIRLDYCILALTRPEERSYNIQLLDAGGRTATQFINPLNHIKLVVYLKYAGEKSNT